MRWDKRVHRLHVVFLPETRDMEGKQPAPPIKLFVHVEHIGAFCRCHADETWYTIKNACLYMWVLTCNTCCDLAVSTPLVLSHVKQHTQPRSAPEQSPEKEGYRLTKTEQRWELALNLWQSLFIFLQVRNSPFIKNHWPRKKWEKTHTDRRRHTHLYCNLHHLSSTGNLQSADIWNTHPIYKHTCWKP